MFCTCLNVPFGNTRSFRKYTVSMDFVQVIYIYVSKIIAMTKILYVSRVVLMLLPSFTILYENLAKMAF